MVAPRILGPVRSESDEEDLYPLRLRRLLWVTPPVGERVSKALQYSIPSTLGQSVPKTLQYSIPSTLGQSVTKIVQYVLLVAPTPGGVRRQRRDPEPEPPSSLVALRRRRWSTTGETVILPVFPTLVATWPWVRRLVWSTSRTHRSASGQELRLGLARYPTWEWEITYEWLPDGPGGATANDLRTLVGVVLAQQGSSLPILLTEPSDCEVTDQLIGEGDGVTREFLLVRSYGEGDHYGTEPVGRVNEFRSLTVGGSVADIAHYAVSTQNWYQQLVVFDVPPDAGQQIRVSMTYYFVVRLGDDDAEFSGIVTDLWECGSIWLRSLKT